MLGANDIDALWLTARLATVTTLALFVIGTPIAAWLAYGRSRLRLPVTILVAMPLVLPPTVLGFYLLLWLSPDGGLGAALARLGIASLPFTFGGLVVASVVYSLPFVVQPLRNAFAAVGRDQLDVAATLGAGPLDRFVHVAVPIARPGFVAAALLGFAHTVGEFGVVLMIGGNIPGVTQVASVRIYEHVEALDYASANALSLTLIAFSFLTLLLVYTLPGGWRHLALTRDQRLD